MRESWATSGVDLHLDLPRGPGKRAALTAALREAVGGGRLAPGTRLPSSRALAHDLGVARNTVAEAYAQLVAEGWLTARHGSGTSVADRPAPDGAASPAPRPLPPEPPYDLRPGPPDLSAFPRAAWLASARRALTSAPNEAFGYGDPRGRPELRRALAGYLARARGVRTDPARLVVCSGYVHALSLLGAVLREAGASTVNVEAYGYDLHWRTVRASGPRPVPVPLDEEGARTDLLEADAALLTPAHQMPTGVALAPRRRAAAVAWARRAGTVVIEDDYDGEFRYERPAVGALQGLDPDHVVYMGTASKSLAPGLRLSWMALPARLVEPVVEARRLRDGWQGPVPDQLTLADLLSCGGYDRHVRRSRLRYRRRRERLAAALARRAPGAEVTGGSAGMHALVRLRGGGEDEAVERGAALGLALHGLDRYRFEGTAPGAPALVVGYGTPPDHAFAGALDRLCRAAAG